MTEDNHGAGRMLARKGERGLARIRGLAKPVAALLSVVMIGAVVAAIAMLTHGAHASGTAAAPIVTSTATVQAGPSCGTLTTLACSTTSTTSTTSGAWIPISADTPAAVLAVFKQSGMYSAAQVSSATGVGDAQYDLSRPETPLFVRELRVPGSMVLPDMYIIPFDTANGAVGYLMLCNVNATHTAIEVNEVMAAGTKNGAPVPHDGLVYLSASAAEGVLYAQRHVRPMPGKQPYLVYTPLDPMRAMNWTGTGRDGFRPLWLVPGADGHDYVIGNDGKAYLPSQVPLAMATP